ncbi:velvet factor-domain-containing protein [Mycena rosella]|uniref:Velvet factor-domain-containing protein n=1 Tax=Mycena rosella TaxID=1033263 RepID=A0AAD7BLD5_MYCRO|nr:velvet factor-domain-containing protein [Mycena rosella]
MRRELAWESQGLRRSAPPSSQLNMKTKFVHPPRVLGNVERLYILSFCVISGDVDFKLSQVELLVRQMPIEARTSNKSDRRVLDPTPVVEVCFYDPESQARVRVPIYQLNGYTLFAALVAADTGKHIAFLSDGITSALSGPANSAPTPAPDPDTDPALPATFFAFPDIGVRLTGTYRLRFTLSLCGDTEHTKRMVMFSAPFRVVSGAHYRGVKRAHPLFIPAI